MLEVENLCIKIGNRPIIKNVSFGIRSGETLGIVGESGSGKSITALGLIGLLPPASKIESGTAMFSINDSKTDLLQLAEQELRAVRGRLIGMIFQEPLTCLNPSVTCGQQIKEAVVNNTSFSGKFASEKSIELLSEMQLPNPLKIYKSYPHQISGGQKQRVMIAIALAGNPQLLIADEPTTALDVTVQKELIALLKQLQKKYKMGMLFISHDLGVIHEVADYVQVMKDGEVVESGLEARVLSYPTSQYTRNLIACRPKINLNPNGMSDEYAIDGIKSKEVKSDYPQYENSRTVFKAENIDTSYITKRNLWGKPILFFNALKNVSFNLLEGEVLGVVGESGSGKTTLGRTILKLIEHRKGNIYYNGADIKKFTQEQLKIFRREVQLIFQDPYSSLNPRMTVGQILVEPLMVYKIHKTEKERRQHVFDLLEKVGMESNSYFKYPHEFSGGQRQRIVIARALTMNPKVIVCDEIVSALDVSVQAQILDLLKELHDRFNLTLLFISHDLAVVSSICNRVIIMKDGSLVEEGVPSLIFSKPQSIYTKMLIDSIPGIRL